MSLAQLRASLPTGTVTSDPGSLAGVRHDQAPTVPAGAPLALVRARGRGDVTATLRWAHQRSVPVVTRGAGSGLAGGANAVDDGLVLDVSAMDAVVEVDPAERLAVVEPGVVNADLSRAAAEVGLAYPPDPASREFSTIGGNVATNAGGLCCVKYGVTGDYVLGLEVVLADGRVLRTGRRTVKGVAGYDLTALFVGSEGTLGVITEITLRLVPIPPEPTTLAAVLPSLGAAGEVITEIVAAGLTPSLLEILDRTTLRAVQRRRPMGLDPDAAAVLLARSDAGGSAGADELGTLERICDAAGASYVASTDDPTEGEALLQARREAYPALDALGTTMLDDVAVPRGRLVEMIDRVEGIADHHGLTIGTFGHAGDGNLHPTIVFDRRDTEARRSAERAFRAILTAARDLGGTIAGEHGIGSLKRRALPDQIGPVGLEVHHDLKDALDPAGILNPGKVIHDRPSR